MLSFRLFLEQFEVPNNIIFEELNDSQRTIMQQMIKGIKPRGPEISKHIQGFKNGKLEIGYTPDEETPENKVHPDVEKHLKSKGFSPISSTHAEREVTTTIPEGPRKGEVIKKVQQQKIGSLLSDNPILQKLHAEEGAKAGAKKGTFGISIHNGENPEDIFRMSSGNKSSPEGKEPWASCMAMKNPESDDPKEQVGGCHHAQFLPQDYKHGTHAAYIHKNGQVIGRVALKPFHGPNGHTILRAERHPDGRMKVYGAQDSTGTAERLIGEFEQKHFPMSETEPFYRKNEHVYDDENLNHGPKKILYNNDPSEETLGKMMKHPDPELVKGMLEHSKINPEHLTQALKHKDKSVRLKALKHPEIDRKHLDKALSGYDIDEHEAVMQNPNVTAKHLETGANHFLSNVRMAAVKHKKIPLQLLHSMRAKEKHAGVAREIDHRIKQKQQAQDIINLRNRNDNI